MFRYVSDETKDVDAGGNGETVRDGRVVSAGVTADRMVAWSEVVDACLRD